MSSSDSPERKKAVLTRCSNSGVLAREADGLLVRFSRLLTEPTSLSYSRTNQWFCFTMFCKMSFVYLLPRDNSPTLKNFLWSADIPCSRARIDHDISPRVLVGMEPNYLRISWANVCAEIAFATQETANSNMPHYSCKISLSQPS